MRIDKKDSIYFKKNLDSLVDSINRVDSEVRRLTEKTEHRTFLIYHPVLTYYARDFGLTQIPLEEENREPSARQMQSVINRARNGRAKVFFVQKEFANGNITSVAESTGTVMTEIDPLGYDWQKEMVKVARCLR